MKYTLFYPETGKMVVELDKVPVTEFLSLDEAHLFITAISDDWHVIQVQLGSDLAAYANRRTGELVVLRELLT